MTKIAIFDIDNTLTESRSAISKDLAKKLSDLIDRIPVALISGGSLSDFEKQIISHLTHEKKSNLYALPTSGAELLSYDGKRWKKIYSRDLSGDKKRKIIEELSKTLRIPLTDLGPYIYDRGSQITYSALGKHVSLEDKYAWDPTKAKRFQLVKALKPRLKGISMTVGGSTSIDFTEEGVDKAFGVRKLLEHLHIAPQSALFVGDALEKGGNDEPVISVGVATRATKDPEDTKSIIDSIIGSLSADGAGRRVKTVAYFCSEYGIEDNIPMYAGGLGVLAGDMVMEAGKRTDLNFLAFGLISKRGMKTLGGTKEEDHTSALEQKGFSRMMQGGEMLILHVRAHKRDIKVCAWHKKYGAATLYLFDSDVEGNSAEDKRITDYLYDTERHTKIIQELILGVAPVKLLAKLDIVPDIYHFNEGHTAFGALAVVCEKAKMLRGKGFSALLEPLKDSMVATKHTILNGSGLYLSYKEFSDYVSGFIVSCGLNPDEAFALGALDRDKSTFSTTKFLIEATSRSNGVSDSHVNAEKKKYPQSPLFAITNGVLPEKWQSPLIRESREWQKDDKALLNARNSMRAELVRFVNGAAGTSFRNDCMTIVWARRLAGYKRPGLLFRDEAMLWSIVGNLSLPVQIVVAGRVHPHDVEGVAALALIKKIAKDIDYGKRIAYLPDFSIEMSKVLVKGADIWLNTPLPGFEACGTSGMKSGLNGGFILSTDDGWVAEASELKALGCIIPERDIEKNIYAIIKERAALFYKGGNPGGGPEWIKRIREIVVLMESKYSVSRMLDDYRKKLYNKNS